MSFETPRGQLPPLTSIRFFAAASIVLFHMLGSFGLPHAAEAGLHLGIGVDLFFILSGFILNYTYRSMDSVGHAFRTIGYRAARIWPLHIVVLIGFLLLPMVPKDPALNSPSHLLAAVFLVQSWVGDYAYTFAGNSVAWTLSVELFFYLLFPFLVMLKTRWLLVVTALISGLTIFWAQSIYSPDGTFGVVTASAITRTHPGMFFPLFVAGMILARLFTSRDWVLGLLQATVLEIAGVALAVWFFLDNENIAPHIAGTLQARESMAFWVIVVVATAFFGPLIFILAIGKGYVSELLSIRPLVFLGEISFATYMCHQVLLPVVTSNLGADRMWYALVYVLLVFVVSWALYRLVERPSNSWLRARINRLKIGRFSSRPDQTDSTDAPPSEPVKSGPDATSIAAPPL